MEQEQKEKESEKDKMSSLLPTVAPANTDTETGNHGNYTFILCLRARVLACTQLHNYCCIIGSCKAPSLVEISRIHLRPVFPSVL